MRALFDNETRKRGAETSALLFAVHLAAVAAAFLTARLVGDGVLHLHGCAFYELTGLCCLTCGATRAAAALARFQLRRSFLLNPVPVFLALFALTVLGHELVCILRKRHRPYKGWVWVIVGIVIAAAIYMLLRWAGIAPAPDSV